MATRLTAAKRDRAKKALHDVIHSDDVLDYMSAADLAWLAKAKQVLDEGWDNSLR